MTFLGPVYASASDATSCVAREYKRALSEEYWERPCTISTDLEVPINCFKISQVFALVGLRHKISFFLLFQRWKFCCGRNFCDFRGTRVILGLVFVALNVHTVDQASSPNDSKFLGFV